MTAGSVLVPSIVPLRPPVPGVPKTDVDTNTKIEIKSASQNVEVYYTMNGTKPAPVQVLGSSEKSTFKYRGPFTLPEGKQTLKALAVSRDGVRESYVNTKEFNVRYIEPDVRLEPPVDDAHSFQHELVRDIQKAQQRKTAWDESGRRVQQAGQSANGSMMHSFAPGGGRFTEGRHHDRMGASDTFNGGDSGRGAPFQKRLPAENFAQSMRLQRETDFMKCVYCYAQRPSDPYARYCNECGNTVPPLPQTKLSIPEPGQMGTCVYCKSTVPLNTDTCIICEAPMRRGQNEPQAGEKLKEVRVCRYCGTGNPASVSLCVVCEGTLPAQAKPVLAMTGGSPPVPKSDGKLRQCTKCSRVNNSDARFCDWCGAKPSSEGMPLVCSKCSANNSPYSQFCASCGVGFAAPARAIAQAGGKEMDKSTWMPISYPFEGMTRPMPQRPVRSHSQTTQTVGLFYPSQRELMKKTEAEEEKAALAKQLRDRKPLLTSVSPGRGYWRKQVEHICMHIKGEAQNNVEFRAMVGEPRMGKLLSAAVHDDGYELTLTTTFALRHGALNQSEPLSGAHLLSDLTERRHYNRYDTEDDSDSIASTGISEAILETPKKRRSPKKSSLFTATPLAASDRLNQSGGKRSPKKREEKQKMPPAERNLLKELGKNGEGRAVEVEALMDEVDSPDEVWNKDGLSLLHMAVINQHPDCIPVLVHAGISVNIKNKSSGDTPLHEAVNLGANGKEMVEILIGLGASLKTKNSKGLTAQDMATKTGNMAATKKFNSFIGQGMVDKFTKPKTGSQLF